MSITEKEAAVIAAAIAAYASGGTTSKSADLSISEGTAEIREMLLQLTRKVDQLEQRVSDMSAMLKSRRTRRKE